MSRSEQKSSKLGRRGDISNRLFLRAIGTLPLSQKSKNRKSECSKETCKSEKGLSEEAQLQHIKLVETEGETPSSSLRICVEPRFGGCDSFADDDVSLSESNNSSSSTCGSAPCNFVFSHPLLYIPSTTPVCDTSCGDRDSSVLSGNSPLCDDIGVVSSRESDRRIWASPPSLLCDKKGFGDHESSSNSHDSYPPLILSDRRIWAPPESPPSLLCDKSFGDHDSSVYNLLSHPRIIDSHHESSVSNVFSHPRILVSPPSTVCHQSSTKHPAHASYAHNVVNGEHDSSVYNILSHPRIIDSPPSSLVCKSLGHHESSVSNVFSHPRILVSPPSTVCHQSSTKQPSHASYAHNVVNVPPPPPPPALCKEEYSVAVCPRNVEVCNTCGEAHETSSCVNQCTCSQRCTSLESMLDDFNMMRFRPLIPKEKYGAFFTTLGINEYMWKRCFKRIPKSINLEEYISKMRGGLNAALLSWVSQ